MRKVTQDFFFTFIASIRRDWAFHRVYIAVPEGFSRIRKSSVHFVTLETVKAVLPSFESCLDCFSWHILWNPNLHVKGYVMN